MNDKPKLRCKVVAKDGREFGPFDTHEEARACVARELPGEPEDTSERDEPNGWRVISIWPD